MAYVYCADVPLRNYSLAISVLDNDDDDDDDDYDM